MPHEDDRIPPEPEEDSRPTRARSDSPTKPPPPEQPPTYAPIAEYKPTREATRLNDTNIPPLAEAAFQLNSSIQNLWNTFVGFSGVVVGLLLTAPEKLSGWPRLLACAIYLMFVAVNFSALQKKYGWLGDVLVSLRMAGRKLDEGELAAFKRAVGRTYIPGDWLSKIGHGDAEPGGVWYRLGKWKLFKFRLGSMGLGLFAYVVIVLSVLAVFWLFPEAAT